MTKIHQAELTKAAEKNCFEPALIQIQRRTRTLIFALFLPCALWYNSFVANVFRVVSKKEG